MHLMPACKEITSTRPQLLVLREVTSTCIAGSQFVLQLSTFLTSGVNYNRTIRPK